MATAKARLQDNAGMTVVEVMIALGVITVGLVALIAAMPLSTSLIGQSNLKTTAAFLAQQQMEKIKNARWTSGVGNDTLGGGGSNGTAAVSVAGYPDRWPDEDYNTIVIPMGAQNASYPRFRRQVRIADCSVVVCSGIPPVPVLNTARQVTVTVSFFPLAGTGVTLATEDNVRLVTLIAFRP